MVRADFDRNLKTLEDDLISLSRMVDQVITKSLSDLKNRAYIFRQGAEEDDTLTSL